MKAPQHLLLSLGLAAAVNALPSFHHKLLEDLQIFNSECHESGLISQNIDGAIGAVLAACDNSFTRPCDGESSKNTTDHCYNHKGCLEFDDIVIGNGTKMHWLLSVDYHGPIRDENVTLSKASCIAGLSQVVLGKCRMGGAVTMLDHNKKYWQFAADPDSGSCPDDDETVRFEKLHHFDLDELHIDT
ncbi:hypothetical protein BU16DRAFT_616304 [Lophium mytilinum]|uniref:Ecp2 effector protein domain-containing protein n=1 Tax=Lophium mytilinum TaxID=390894 RepID=A0A6A6R0E0_9PEZI|nr:hypothetical protein BU16DRAFT_616304 [Lophium mytilinum]